MVTAVRKKVSFWVLGLYTTWGWSLVFPASCLLLESYAACLRLNEYCCEISKYFIWNRERHVVIMITLFKVIESTQRSQVWTWNDTVEKSSSPLLIVLRLIQFIDLTHHLAPIFSPPLTVLQCWPTLVSFSPQIHLNSSPSSVLPYIDIDITYGEVKI